MLTLTERTRLLLKESTKCVPDTSCSPCWSTLVPCTHGFCAEVCTHTTHMQHLETGKFTIKSVQVLLQLSYRYKSSYSYSLKLCQRLPSISKALFALSGE